MVKSETESKKLSISSENMALISLPCIFEIYNLFYDRDSMLKDPIFLLNKIEGICFIAIKQLVDVGSPINKK